MVVSNILEIVSEFFSIVVCMHMISQKKFKWDSRMVYLVGIYIICVGIQVIYHINYTITAAAIFGIFFYEKWYLTDSVKNALQGTCICCITIMSLQLIFFYCIKGFLFERMDKYLYAVCVNCGIIVILLFWNMKRLSAIIRVVNKYSICGFEFILFCNFSQLIYFAKCGREINGEIMFQVIAAIISMGFIAALFIDSERNKKIIKQEIRMYEIYNKSFENMIKTIRMKQHEFDNHITAIQNMQYIYKDKNELLRMQEEYCEKLLSDNKLNKLLKINLHPVLSQAIYSQMTRAQEKDIVIEFEVEDIVFSIDMELHEILEIINILLDNAIEYLETKEYEKLLKLRISEIDDDNIMISVKNSCDGIDNEKLKEFFKENYTTKNGSAGVGLNRLKALCAKNRVKLIARIEEETITYVNMLVILKRLKSK